MREKFPLTTTDSPNPKNLGGRGAPLRFSRPRRDVWDGQVQRRTQKAELRVSADAQADMPSAGASGAICVQRFDDSLTSCNSHYVSHFAAFFIVARAKISIGGSCVWLFCGVEGAKAQRALRQRLGWLWGGGSPKARRAAPHRELWCALANGPPIRDRRQRASEQRHKPQPRPNF